MSCTQKRKRTPRLTVGMATFDDWHGVFFTIQGLRLSQFDNAGTRICDDVEFVVVDNAPGSAASPHIRDLLGNIHHHTAGAKYVAAGEAVGTSPARDRVFAEASAPYVLCLDCHVLLDRGALASLLAYYDAHPDTDDLLQGPLLMDSLGDVCTHFDDVWRAEMWGIWGAAWKCGCGDNGVRFSPTVEDNVVVPRLLKEGRVPVTSCHACGEPLPTGLQHPQQLANAGYQRIGMDPYDEPFEIPGQGLGLFSARRESWAGFHPASRGFGGEEMYVHRKYRRRGNRTLCLPALRWNHRFSRAGNVPYPLTLFNKVRNLVLEFEELGDPLDPIHEHFVAERRDPKTGEMKPGPFSQDQWDALTADALNATPGSTGCNTCSGGGKQDWSPFRTVEAVYEMAVNRPRDLNEHLPKLRELAAECDTVAEFTGRRESTIAFLAAGPKTLITHNAEEASDQLLKHLATVRAADDTHAARLTDWRMDDLPSPAVGDLPIDVDLLFLDTEHTASRVDQELRTFGRRATRYIVLHDTFTYKDNGSDGGPGLNAVLLAFLRDHPRWSVIYHTTDQHGLTVLGCRPEDKPQLPGKFKMAANLSKAVVRHVADGLKKVPKKQFAARLGVCSLCPVRNGDRCSQCGCPVAEKAAARSEQCPLDHWRHVDAAAGDGVPADQLEAAA